MVMVLLFLGVIFLLLGWQALDSSGSDEEASTVTTASTTAAATSSSAKPAAANQAAEVRVYNISAREGIAARTADDLKAAGFKVTEVTNLAVPDVSATTVYFTDDGDKATAEAVGQKLGAPVEKRISALSEQPPGVIVLVMG
jgi:hypothetical protein